MLTKALDDYEREFHDKKIDLVVLSHFDKDHISGLVDLLSRFKVGVLMLPFVPLWLRLAIAFDSGVTAGSAAFKYFLNPVKSFGSLPNVTKIILVPGKGDEVADGGLDGDPREPDDKRSLDVSWPRCVPTGEMQVEIDSVLSAAGVDVLPVGKPVLVQDFWEYLPYNDRTVASPPPGFVNAVEGLRDSLLASPSDHELKALKKAYDVQFGTGSKPRNVISLFLYAGPVEEPTTTTWANAWSTGSGQTIIWAIENKRLGAFYTGDGYLNTPKRLDQFIAFYGVARIAQCLCFQVMHHGAKGNWRRGTGALFAPTYSIFSARQGGKRPRHPSGEVLKDFARFGPRVVHEASGFDVRVR